MRDRCTALVITINTLWLCRGFRHKVTRLSINQMELGDINSGKGGGRLQGIGGLKLCIYLAELRSRGSLGDDTLLPLRYRAWQQVGRRSSRALIAK